MNQDRFLFRRKGRVLFFIPFILMVLAVISAVVMLLWNNIIPDVTGWKPITYWQSVGILILSKILFGKFVPPRRKPMPPFFIDFYKERYTHASPEERQKMKEEWRKRCHSRQGGWDRQEME